ncbi:carboxymuconolactone decarboxylase family protein [Stieleria sp. JC731]|uniref:carboxymuconolactone decarboxylase family protein n=1 Tax=Pirellulaceae TaxID=2691357 RepID=UPI001E4B2CA2|nr:carboxymuconolactone decarboxylase family protein [Stieleria sp. JC731]MCC9603310.1 carboxymuconolactone decarboxylase family protein [Stieleria sp. JC731]
MTQRLNYPQLLAKEVQLLMTLESHVEDSGLPLNLLEFVKLRCSILNGCAFCVCLHTQRLRQQGESDLRIDLIPAWREAPCYSKLERAALAFAEELTLVSQSHCIKDDVYQPITELLSDSELARLTLAIGLINTWNRFALAFQSDLSGVDYLLKQTRSIDEAFANQLQLQTA